MKRIVNTFRIQGLESLSASYRLADVIGLDKDQTDYFRSIDRLTSLSRTLRRPVSFLDLSTGPAIAFPDGTPVPATLDLGTRVLSLRPRMETIEIDFSRSSQFDALRLRIVRFAIEEHLRGLRHFWQPSAGQAFFNRQPDRTDRGVGLYYGSRLRPMVLSDGGLGLCIDKTSRLIAVQSLPTELTKEQFEDQWKGQRCIYHYGDSWYQIRAEMLARHAVADFPIRVHGSVTTLSKFLLDTLPKPVPKEVANLNPGGSVVVYRNARGEDRSAPTQLCYPIRDTDEVRHTSLGQATIIEPSERLAWSRDFVGAHLAHVKVGGVTLSIDSEPLEIQSVQFQVPDLRFGGGRILSVRGTPQTCRISLQELGSKRLALLEDPGSGILVTSRLDRQYILLPQTAAASFGPAFVSDLTAAVDRLHPKGGYRPEVIAYDDTVRRTFAEQARAVNKGLEAIPFPGFAVAMIHRCKGMKRTEDRLAAYVLRQAKERFDTVASVVHYDTADRFYEPGEPAALPRVYRIRREYADRARGYLRNVALNKVLLSNQNWPFGLEQPLNADLTIGIDVKNNACCLVSVCERGQKISSQVHVSKQKEKLNAVQLCAYLTELIRDEAQRASAQIRRIVIHRDGRAWTSELNGVRRAIETLKSMAILPPEAELTVLEIHKKPSVPLRIYELVSGAGSAPRKPGVGTAYIGSPVEAFICTTGWPFRQPGTPNPIQIQKVFGTMTIEECAQDLYSLSTLAWTRPEGCSRYPVTLRLADRFLADEAAEYDEDELIFGSDEHIREGA